MAERGQRGATSVVDRMDGPTTSVPDDNPTTLDIPLPPRAVRIGLSSAPVSAPAAPVASTPVAPTPVPVRTASISTPAPAAPEPVVAESTVSETAAESIAADKAPSAAAVEAHTTQDLPVTAGPADGKRGRHRAGPPNALKARATLIAVAAGAVAVAVSGSSNYSSTGNAEPAPVDPTPTATADTTANPALAAASEDLDGGAVPAASKADMDGYSDQLAVGKKLAAAAAAREAAARKPLFVSPIPMGTYQFTSGYAMRWGSFHGGLDLAAPLGTPIHAVTDGTVVEAGPASGYGNWVQVKAADGTITMYGHMASSGVLVQKGQKVTAGDVIALVGSEGFSTGPHLHFEVWKNGSSKIDPAPWLASKGIRLSAYSG